MIPTSLEPNYVMKHNQSKHYFQTMEILRYKFCSIWKIQASEYIA
jgi:hypothetical protein